MKEEPEAPSPKRGPHYITDKKGKRLAVVVPLGQYKRLVQVHKRVAKLEQQAHGHQAIEEALAELRTLLEQADRAEPVDALLSLLGEEGGHQA